MEINLYIPCMFSVLSCSSSVSSQVCLSCLKKSKGHVQTELLRTSCNWYVLSKSLVQYFQVDPRQVALCCACSGKFIVIHTQWGVQTRYFLTFY